MYQKYHTETKNWLASNSHFQYILLIILMIKTQHKLQFWLVLYFYHEIILNIHKKSSQKCATEAMIDISECWLDWGWLKSWFVILVPNGYRTRIRRKRSEFNQQFWWVNKGALRRATTCLDSVALWIGDVSYL